MYYKLPGFYVLYTTEYILSHVLYTLLYVYTMSQVLYITMCELYSINTLC